MIDYFPPTAVDETLHSALARLRVYMGAKTHLGTIRAAFGPEARNVRPLMTGGLDAFTVNLTGHAASSGGDAVARWTAFPYFAPFMTPEAAARLESDLRCGHERGGYTGFGLFRGSADGHSRLNYCAECRDVDRVRYGLGCWRRTHQLPGVYVCPWHGKPLRATNVTALGSERLLHCPVATDDAALPVPYKPEHALAMARHSLWLLENPRPPVPSGTLQAAFRSFLRERDLISRNGSAVSGMHRMVGEALLKPGSSLPALGEARNCRTDMGRLWGRAETLGAPTCRVLNLLCFLDADPRALFERCDGLAGRPDGNVRGPAVRARQSTVERHRSVLSELVARHPGKSRSQLRKACPSTYCWLLEHDRSWLMKALPEPLRPRCPKPWKAADAELAGRAREVIASLRAESPRLTFGRIAGRMGCRTSLYRRDARLPKTLALVDSAVEDDGQFMRRRAEAGLRDPNIKTAGGTWSSFLSASGLRRGIAGPELMDWTLREFASLQGCTVPGAPPASPAA